MSGFLCLLAQLAAVAVGVYLMFAKGLSLGVALIVFSQVLHWLIGKLAYMLTSVHVLTMTRRTKEALERRMRLEGGEPQPAVWLIISSCCGYLYVVGCCTLIWLALIR